MSRDPIPSWYFTLVVVKRGNEILLVREKQSDVWSVPAGRAEPGETLAMAARRKVLEETGVPVRLTGLLRLEHTPIPGGARVRAFFLAEPIDDAPVIGAADPAAVPAAWVPVSALSQHRLRAPEVEQILKSITNGGEVYPLDVLHYEGETS